MSRICASRHNAAAVQLLEEPEERLASRTPLHP
jgi:hypothetical protein